jgi:hypothetical protein
MPKAGRSETQFIIELEENKKVSRFCGGESLLDRGLC